MREIVLQLKAPHTWLSEITSKHPTTIRILDCKPSETKDGVRQLVEVSADQDQLDKIVNEVKASPLVKEAYVVQTKRGRMLGSLLTESAFCGTIMRTEAFCRSCFFQSKANPDGTVEWTLAFNKREALAELLDGMKNEQVDVKILKLSSVADVENLTSHQRSLVETALEEGFFDYPRRITLRELSKKMGISASTASEVLRRAERKILSSYQTHETIQGLEDKVGTPSLGEQILKGKRV
jgi:predicted DNA binding protein